MTTFEQLAALIRSSEVGRDTWLETPFGRRLLCYADVTATGRYLHFIEAWLARVNPYYANTHTVISSTGRVMTALREEARQAIGRAVGANADDVVMFVGSGATAAINKLVGILGLRIAEPLDRQYRLSDRIPRADRPLVVIGPYEHHSNQLPWVESIADVVEIDLDAAGGIALDHLEQVLALHAARPFKIGSFSAASNVTGVLSDVPAITRILHRHGAYACFDYAAAAPYVPINMHPWAPEEQIDALFVSAHKFMGGPQSSGVLVANRALFHSRVPERPGGGTVHYVSFFSGMSIDYLAQLEEREEGGTPAITSDLRAGVAFLLKEKLGPEQILQHELVVAQRALERLSRHPRIHVLGPLAARRLPILSFNIAGLHHDLVSLLLDHLFGIQNRAGCSCAGPYGHRLLGIDHVRSERYRLQIKRGVLGLKPGWVRVSLPFYVSETDLEFILQSIEFVAEHGRDFVPLYELDWHTGVWRHRDSPQLQDPPITLTLDGFERALRDPAAATTEAVSEARLATERQRYLSEARALAAALHSRWTQEEPLHWNPPTGVPEVDALIWFDYVHASSVQPDSRLHVPTCSER